MVCAVIDCKSFFFSSWQVWSNPNLCSLMVSCAKISSHSLFRISNGRDSYLEMTWIDERKFMITFLFALLPTCMFTVTLLGTILHIQLFNKFVYCITERNECHVLNASGVVTYDSCLWQGRPRLGELHTKFQGKCAWNVRCNLVGNMDNRLLKKYVAI